MKGWICPKCGKVYGPDVKECAGCNAKIVNPITWIPYYPDSLPCIHPWWGIYPPAPWQPSITCTTYLLDTAGSGATEESK